MSALEEDVRQLTEIDSGALAMLNSSEINQQIATAHKYPRNITRFRDEVFSLATLNESVAESCVYALPRKQDGKRITIYGPSVRFAEILAHSWRNCRLGARPVDMSGDYVTAQGVYHDLETNVYIAFETKRRITDKNGNRYGADMITMTANAAAAIALRNAILRGIPKAIWEDAYEEARKVIMGNAKTLATRRAEALKFVAKYGLDESQVCELLGVPGSGDIDLEELATLRGICTSLKEGVTTVEQLLREVRGEAEPPKIETSGASAKARERAQGKGKPEDAPKGDQAPTPPAGARGTTATQDERPPAAKDAPKAYPLADMLLMVSEAESVGQLQYVQDLHREHLDGPEQAQLEEAIAAARQRFAEPK